MKSREKRRGNIIGNHELKPTNNFATNNFFFPCSLPRLFLLHFVVQQLRCQTHIYLILQFSLTPNDPTTFFDSQRICLLRQYDLFDQRCILFFLFRAITLSSTQRCRAHTHIANIYHTLTQHFTQTTPFSSFSSLIIIMILVNFSI